jgi:hypothetical protein
MANYLQKPQVYQAIQWDGTNASAVQAQVNDGDPTMGGTAFRVDANGNGIITIYHNDYPVPVGDWLVTGIGTPAPLTDAQFQATYVAGSAFVVAS